MNMNQIQMVSHKNPLIQHFPDDAHISFCGARNPASIFVVKAEHKQDGCITDRLPPQFILLPRNSQLGN